MDSVTRKSLGLWSAFLFFFLLLLILRYQTLDKDYFDNARYTEVSSEYLKIRDSTLDLYTLHKDLHQLTTSFFSPPNLTMSETEFDLRSSASEGWVEIIRLIRNF
jgi:hypothetical protein